MSSKRYICGAFTENNDSLVICMNLTTDNKTCDGHKGFYNPQHWLDWLDRKTKGYIQPYLAYSFNDSGAFVQTTRNYYLEHLIFVLRNGRVKLGPEHMKCLPPYMYDSSTIKGRALALMLYETQPDICKDWSPLLWERIRRDLLKGINRTFDYKSILKAAVRTPAEFCEFFREMPVTHQGYDIFHDALAWNSIWAYDEAVDALAVKCGFTDYLILLKQAFEKKQQALAKASVAVFKEELMARCWHPDRFVTWCLDLVEKADWLAV
jgi:hypothetical protein